MGKVSKIVLLIIVMVISMSYIFATESMLPQDNVTYNMVTNRYSKTSARILSMGGAGIAVRSNQDALYVNPASLGEKGLVWNVPNVAFTLYNTRKLVDTGIIENYQTIKDDIGKYTQALYEILSGSGNNKLATVDSGFGAKWGRFAFAVDSQINLNTYLAPGNNAPDTVIIPQVDVVASAGLGLRFFRSSPVNFDIGIASRFNIRAYYEKVDISTIMNAINDSSDFVQSLQTQKQVMVGYSIPIDIGFNLNVPGGVTFSAVARNINGNFKFSQYKNLQEAQKDANNVIKSKLIVESPMSVDVGFGWKPNWGLSWLANPNIAVDVVDVISLTKGFSTTNLLAHMRAGIEVELLKLLELRAGINQGYVSIGAGVNLMNLIHLEASYYRLEFGEKLLNKPVDALTIRMNLFWER